ncbi:MAG: acetyl-CoA carboxylase biotin carboxylase subunit [Proteobacteria bacterium]|nr:acetyl-CoA carboxylase biotin carboxylase subunit [Pseudomonadota bacterium]
MSFGTVLIANRGEIALRIIRACRQLGLKSVAICSKADQGASYLDAADHSVCIGGPTASESYMDGSAILMAAEATGADAIHPGYGFLSENADFAERVEAAGLVFIGPTAGAMRTMGDKIAAKAAMRASAVPCVPGTEGALSNDAEAMVAAAEAIGYPVIVKAAGGGGGRGMRVVRSVNELDVSVQATREEARRTFNNPEVYLEKFLEKPRHIEIQVLCDHHGNAVWLGERDCSVQRRHQKVIEEGPALGIPREAIGAVGERCVAACKAIGYRGAGTLEFLYEDGVFAFIEMNTRIQVEHPVTEALTGIDLVAEQIQIAQGNELSIHQSDITVSGHAIECRINAEHSLEGLPSPGTVVNWHSPGGPGVRVDTHVARGTTVPPYYDSLIAKVIATGRDRAEALSRMRGALAEMRVAGIEVNIALHQAILRDPAFVTGPATIHYLEKALAEKRFTVS